MAQYSGENPIVSPHSGADLVGDVNGVIKAMLSQHAGTSRPAGLEPGGVWVKVNNATTPTTFEVMLYNGVTDVSVGDVDMTANLFQASARGRLLGIREINSVGLTQVTPSAGCRIWYMEFVGTGGNGEPADSDTSGGQIGDAGAGGGGSSGAGGVALIDVSSGSYQADITIGAQGSLGVAGNGNEVGGTNAGDSTFDDGNIVITVPGGQVGLFNYDSTGIFVRRGGNGPNAASYTFATTDLLYFKGIKGSSGLHGFAVPQSASDNGTAAAFGGAGGASMLGRQTRGGVATSSGFSETGYAGEGPGSGGSGAATVGSVVTVQGGLGALGMWRIWEFS